jgi:hypothetical protein
MPVILSKLFEQAIFYKMKVSIAEVKRPSPGIASITPWKTACRVSFSDLDIIIIIAAIVECTIIYQACQFAVTAIKLNYRLRTKCIEIAVVYSIGPDTCCAKPLSKDLYIRHTAAHPLKLQSGDSGQGHVIFTVDNYWHVCAVGGRDD